MAIYHLNARTGSRSGGQSAAAKDQYIEREGKYAGKNNNKKSDVEIVMSGNMPEWANDHRDYWKAADDHERINGRLYKEVEFALPVEISIEERGKAVREFAEYLTKKERLPYTLAIHINDVNNPHCHLMISERMNDGIERSPELWFVRANPNEPSKGGAKKTESLKPKDWLLSTREAWATIANSYLEAGEAIDHRTLKEQGIDREPTKHRGVHREAKEYYNLESEAKQIEKELRETIKELKELRAKRREGKREQEEADRRREVEQRAATAAEGEREQKPEPVPRAPIGATMKPEPRTEAGEQAADRTAAPTSTRRPDTLAKPPDRGGATIPEPLTEAEGESERHRAEEQARIDKKVKEILVGGQEKLRAKIEARKRDREAKEAEEREKQKALELKRQEQAEQTRRIQRSRGVER